MGWDEMGWQVSTTTIFDTKDGLYIHQSLPNLSAIFKNGSCHPGHNACFPQTPKAIPLPQNLQIDSPHYYAMNIHKDKRQTSFLKCYTEVEIYNVLRQLEGKKDIHKLSGSLYFFFFLLMTGCSLVTCFFSILGRSTWESKELILSKSYNNCDYYYYNYYYYNYNYYYFFKTKLYLILIKKDLCTVLHLKRIKFVP